MVYEIFKDFEISCSHRLHDKSLTKNENTKIFGKCNNLPSHGHNYFVRVTLRSSQLRHGMVRNFNDIKSVFMKEIDAVYDHQFLNDVKPFKDGNGLVTTAENMCFVFYKILKKELPELYSVTIWETSKSCSLYKED